MRQSETVSSLRVLRLAACALAAGCAYDPYVVATRSDGARPADGDAAATDTAARPPRERPAPDTLAWPRPSAPEAPPRAQDYCFRAVASASHPPPTGGFALAYDPHRRELLWTGVKTDLRPGTQTWRWDGAWTRLVPRAAPSPRVDPAFAWDPAGARLVLFGGVVPNEPARAWDDTWAWDGATWRALPSARGPSARALATASAGPPDGAVVLFDGRARETWRFERDRWTPKRTADAPSARRGHALAYDPARRVAVLFGGAHDVTGDLGDTWTFDGAAWTRHAPARGPSPRAGAAMAYDPRIGRVVLTGGAAAAAGEARRVLGDAWLWDGRAWAEATCTASAGGSAPRAFHRMAYDEARDVMVLVGGEDHARTWLADTWIR